MAVAVLLLALVVGGLIALVANLDLRTVVIAILLLIGSLAVVGRMVGRGLGRTWGPVRRLIEGLGALADGDYSARVPDDAAGPMRPVVRSFNETARRLEESDDHRRRLLADLGHELRTPLTVVRGEVEAMLDGVHPSDPDHLEVLLDEVTVLERLIEDLRTLSLAEAGALTLHREPTDLGALVVDIADAHRRSAAAAGIDIDLAVAEGGGDVMVDPVRMREVVTNLIVNAIRAMPHGGRLLLEVTSNAASTSVVVGDTGTGIPADDLEHVFERFQKSPRSPGSGLGLTISRDLVRAHGGTIDISSTEGVGTEVRVDIPHDGLRTAPPPQR
jgi:signal transduction histidine kinase